MTKQKIWALFLSLAAVTGISGVNSHSLHEVDLAIGASSSWQRPAILIAWRNTFKVFEAEVLVQNFGEDTGHGRVHLEIVDPFGQRLLRHPASGDAVLVEVPGKAEGGIEGEIVQVIGSKEANQLIDRLDREGVHYTIRAVVETVEGDLNPINNVSGKTYNVEARLLPDSLEQFSYFLSNNQSVPLDLSMEITYANLPNGWLIDSKPTNGEMVRLEPGQILNGFVRMARYGKSGDGEKADIIIRATDTLQNRVHDVREWYVSADTNGPELQNSEQIVQQDNGIVHVEVVAFDKTSGIKEASGVRLEYTTDDGLTFSNKVMAYSDGDFMRPTRFLAEIGPFVQGTSVSIALSVSDSAGNVTRRDLGKVIIGQHT